MDPERKREMQESTATKINREEKLRKANEWRVKDRWHKGIINLIVQGTNTRVC